MNFTTEQIKKAKTAKTAEELLAMAKAENFPMTEDEAQKIFAELHKQGELSDDELAAIAGGKGETAVQHPEPKYAAGESHWLKKEETWATIVAVWWSDVDRQWTYQVERAITWDVALLGSQYSQGRTKKNTPDTLVRNEWDLTKLING